MSEVFPPGYFFICNVASGKVIDVEYNGKALGRLLVLWDRKESDNDTQLWEYTRGFLRNKGSGLYLQVSGFDDGGIVYPGAGLIQANEHDPPYTNLCWAYIQEDRRLVPYDARLCVWTKQGDVYTNGARLTVDKVKERDDPTQQWVLEGA